MPTVIQVNFDPAIWQDGGGSGTTAGASGYDAWTIYPDRDGVTFWDFEWDANGFARVNLSDGNIVHQGAFISANFPPRIRQKANAHDTTLWAQDSAHYYILDGNTLVKFHIAPGPPGNLMDGYCVVDGSYDVSLATPSLGLSTQLEDMVAVSSGGVNYVIIVTPQFIPGGPGAWVINTDTMTLVGVYQDTTFAYFQAFVDKNEDIWICGATNAVGASFVKWHPPDGATGGNLNVTQNTVSNATLGFVGPLFFTYVPANHSVFAGAAISFVHTGNTANIDLISFARNSLHLDDLTFFFTGMPTNQYGGSSVPQASMDAGVMNGVLALPGDVNPETPQIGGIINIIDPATLTLTPSGPISVLVTFGDFFGSPVYIIHGLSGASSYDLVSIINAASPPTALRFVTGSQVVPFVMFQVIPAPAPAMGTITIQKTVISGTPADHTYPFTMRPSWKPPFTLIDGGSDVSTVPAGVYSITEDPVALINESLSVSNGDPPSAIVVAGGSGNPIVNTTFWDGVLSGVAFPLSAPTSPGNGLIVAVCSWGPAAVVASIVTDAGDAFTGMPLANIPAAYNPTGGVLTTALFFLPAGLGGAAHMTIVSSFTMDIFVYEVIPGLSVDVAGFNDWKVTGDSQFPSMPPLVGTGAADLYIACLTNNSGTPATAAAPWTLDIPVALPGGGGTAGFRAAHFVGSGSQVPVFDQSSSDHFSVSGAAFKFTPPGAIIVDVVNTRSVPGPPGGTSFVPKLPIGHGPFQVVPTDNSPNQAWQVSVSVNNKSIPLGVVLRYNEIAKYWVATISDSQGNVLLDSIPLITGDNFTQNILRQFAYLGIGSAAIFNASAKSA